MNKHRLVFPLLSLFLLWPAAVIAEPPPELVELWNSVEALATDRTYSGRISDRPLAHWKEATDSAGKVKFSNHHDMPMIKTGGSREEPLYFRDVDFRDRTLFVNASNVVFENCIFDASRDPEAKTGYSWVRFSEGVERIAFLNCEFTGKKGEDSINGGLAALGKTGAENYPENYLRAGELVVERCRFKWSTGDYVKASFGPGTVFRHNYFGYGWMFDPEIIPWTKKTGGVGIKKGDLVIYRSARSRAKADYPDTMPPAKQGEPDTDEWENLGDIPHFDYVQDDDGGPVLWEANLFEVGLQDIPQIQRVNNAIRFARDFGTHRPIAGQRFIGNVFRLRENYSGPYYPVVITHKASEDQTLEEVNVIGRMEFSHNLLIPKLHYDSALFLQGKAEENLIFAQNYLTGDRTPLPAPAKSISTTRASIPDPLPTRAQIRAPEILYPARMLWKNNEDGTRSYRTLPPIYENRADSVEVVATLNGVKLENHDDSLVHTHPQNSRFKVKYVLKNPAGTVESEAVPRR